MEEQPGRAPEWALYLAGAILVVLPAFLTASYGVWRMVFWIKEQRRLHRAEDAKLDAAAAETKERAIEVREKTALDRANEVIERLTRQVEGYEDAVKEVRRECEAIKQGAEERARACEAEHAATKAMLKLVAAWARRKGMPMTGELNRLIEEDRPTGSGVQPTTSGGQAQ